LVGKSLRQIKPADELPLIQHAFRCGVCSDPNLHVDDAQRDRERSDRGSCDDVPW